MSKSVVTWLLTVLLLVYGSYTLWLATAIGNYWFLLWTAGCFIAGVGLVLSRKWAQYFVYYSRILHCGWIDLRHDHDRSKRLALWPTKHYFGTSAQLFNRRALCSF